MAITPINYEEGQLVNLPFATGVTTVKGGAVTVASGYYTNAAAGTTLDVRYICMEAVTTTANGQEVLCLRVMNRVVFEADTALAPVRATDVGVVVDLASVSTVNESASANDLFYVEDIVGPTTDLKVRGYFVEGAPNA